MSDKPHRHDKPAKHETRALPPPTATQRLTSVVEANPLTVVAGGLAIGAVVGALLPRSDGERRLLAPVGQRLGTGVVAAFEAAKQAGLAELDQAGISRDHARQQARGIVDGLVRAASSAGSAALEAAGKSAV